MINSIRNPEKDVFHMNNYLINLVNISINHIDNDIFIDILDFIQSTKIDNIVKKIKLIKNKLIKNKLIKQDKRGSIDTYDNIQDLIKNIYEDEHCDNLRGCFLELLIYYLVNDKHGRDGGYISDLNCYVEIDNIRSSNTVDVFALWGSGGFVCECKVGCQNFDGIDLSNLNKIYYDSNNVLSPFIISLASKKFLEQKVYDINLKDSSNVWVNSGDITIFSIDDFIVKYGG